MKENVFEVTSERPDAGRMAAKIAMMTVEQLLFAGQLADRVKFDWSRRYLGGVMVSIIVEKNTLGGARSFDVSVDQAYEIYEFPKEARDLLVELLVKDLCK